MNLTKGKINRIKKKKNQSKKRNNRKKHLVKKYNAKSFKKNRYINLKNQTLKRFGIYGGADPIDSNDSVNNKNKSKSVTNSITSSNTVVNAKPVSKNASFIEPTTIETETNNTKNINNPLDITPNTTINDIAKYFANTVLLELMSKFDVNTDMNFSDILKKLANDRIKSSQPSSLQPSSLQQNSNNNLDKLDKLDKLQNDLNNNRNNYAPDAPIAIPVYDNNNLNGTQVKPNVTYAMDNGMFPSGVAPYGTGMYLPPGVARTGTGVAPSNMITTSSNVTKDNRDENIIKAENETLADDITKNLSRKTIDFTNEISNLNKKINKLNIQKINEKDKSKIQELEKEILQNTNQKNELEIQLKNINEEIEQAKNKIKVNNKTLQSKKSYSQRAKEMFGYNGTKNTEEEDERPRIGESAEKKIDMNESKSINANRIDNDNSVNANRIDNDNSVNANRIDNENSVNANRIDKSEPNNTSSTFKNMGSNVMKKVGDIRSIFTNKKTGGRIKSNNYKKTKKLKN